MVFKQYAVLSYSGPRPCLCSSAEWCLRKQLAMVRGDVSMPMASGSSSLLLLGWCFSWYGKSQPLSHCWDCSRGVGCPICTTEILRSGCAGVRQAGAAGRAAPGTFAEVQQGTGIALICGSPGGHPSCRESSTAVQRFSFQHTLRVLEGWGCIDSPGVWSWGCCRINQCCNSGWRGLNPEEELSTAAHTINHNYVCAHYSCYRTKV